MLTVSIYYIGTVDVTQLQVALLLPLGITDTNGSTAASSVLSSLSPNTIFQVSYHLDIANTLPTGVYYPSIEFSWNTNTNGITVFHTETEHLSFEVLGVADLSFQSNESALVPGRVNHIEVTLNNTGSGEASQITTSVSSVSSVGVLNSTTNLTSISAHSAMFIGISVYVPISDANSPIPLYLTASFTDPYGNARTTTQTLGFYASSLTAPVLIFQTQNASMFPSQTNTAVITLANLGRGAVSDVRTEIASSTQFSVLNQFPVVSNLGPNSSITANIEIYMSASLSGSPITLTFTTSYIDQYGSPGTSTQTLGFYVINANTSLTSDLISVVPLRNQVRVGIQSNVSFLVKNIGEYNLTSPVLSLAISSPLIVTANSSLPIEGVLRPGQTVVYDATVGAGTSSTPGFYTATLTLNYIDQSGSRASASVSTGLVLSGTIIMVVQGAQVTQGNTTLTVSGSILNKGFSNAYYTSVTGLLVGSKVPSQADYVGEVDTNILIPFSVTIDYLPQTSPNLKTKITINVSYEDSLGKTANYTATIAVTLKSASQLSGSPSTGPASSSSSTADSGQLALLEYGVVAALTVVAIAGVIYVRRNRAAGRNGGMERNGSGTEVI